MTAFGFCVVAALSSQINCRPWTRSCRIGKSWRINRGSSGRLATPSSAGARSGRNSKDSTPFGRDVDCVGASFRIGSIAGELGIAGRGTPGASELRMHQGAQQTAREDRFQLEASSALTKAELERLEETARRARQGKKTSH